MSIYLVSYVTADRDGVRLGTGARLVHGFVVPDFPEDLGLSSEALTDVLIDEGGLRDGCYARVTGWSRFGGE